MVESAEVLTSEAATIDEMAITTYEAESKTDTSTGADAGESSAWPAVTKALMATVIKNQVPQSAAGTLLGVFRPMVDEWAVAKREAKRWKERAHAYVADVHRLKEELGGENEVLREQVMEMEQKLAETQTQLISKTKEVSRLANALEAKERSAQEQRSVFHTTISQLQTKISKLENDHRATTDAYRNEAQARKLETEALNQKLHDATQEASQTRHQLQAQISQLQEMIKDQETLKSKLQESLDEAMKNNTSLEQQLANKIEENSNLQARAIELANQCDILQRQLATYQRRPTRRFMY